MAEGLQNLTRIVLVLDVIAELYLLQNFEKYWSNIFNANPESNPDYQLRWALYRKWATFSMGPNDLLLIPNALLKNQDEIEKLSLAKATNVEIDIMLRREKIRRTKWRNIEHSKE